MGRSDGGECVWNIPSEMVGEREKKFYSGTESDRGGSESDV